jgi:hypothetical protein
LEEQMVYIRKSTVIGGVLSTRFLLNEIDVTVYAQNLETTRIVGKTTNRDRREYRLILSVSLSIMEKSSIVVSKLRLARFDTRINEGYAPTSSMKEVLCLN